MKSFVVSLVLTCFCAFSTTAQSIHIDIDMDVDVYFEKVSEDPEGNELLAYKFRIAGF